MCTGLGLLLTGVLVLAGCASDDHLIKPPPRHDEIVRPPDDDPRFSGPPKYPKGSLDTDILMNRIKDKADEPGAKGPRFGAGGPGGVGGGGY
jgi:hypothetical protein